MENRAEDDDESMVDNQDKDITGEQLQADHKFIIFSIQENKKQLHNSKIQIELLTNTLQSLILKTCSNKMKMKTIDPKIIGHYIRDASNIQKKLDSLKQYVDE